MHVPLRVHSVYSKGRGGASLEELAWWFARTKTPAAALADIGKLFGWAKWKRAGRAAGFTPLFGCEIELGAAGDAGDGGAADRFVFIVRAPAGYPNLMEILNRRAVREGDGTEGLVTIFIPGNGGHDPMSEAAPGSPNAHVGTPRGFPPELSGAPPPDVRLWAIPPPPSKMGSCPSSSASCPPFVGRLLDSLRGGPAASDVYVGADFSNFRQAREFAAGRGLPLVWANPLKFVRAPERLVLLHAFDKKVPYPPEWDRLKPTLPLFGPEQEVLALKKFGAGVTDAFRATFAVAEKCGFDFADIVPPLPADIFPVTLRDEVLSRLRAAKGLSWDERERAQRELAVIEKAGFGPYFLIVHDIVEFARRNGILHNLKGSGAGSFLTWLLGISHVNPAAFGLYFERFLNSGRSDPPDIDLDFDSRFRDKVLSYVLERYGGGRTGAAFVCSLKNYRARSALYETARALGLPPDESRALSKKAPYFAEPDYLKTAKPAVGYLDVWKLAAELGQAYAEVSLHVGGVVLTPAPADRYLPLEASAKGYRMCHYDRDAVEDLKLIKLDLLSVRGLAAISEAKTRLGLADIPLDESRTFALLKQAKTIACFQVESPAMMNLLRRMKPENVRELTAALALIRPGPTESGMKEGLLRSREGRGSFRDPFLARILPETDGIMLYEEQVMQIAERVAGMPPEEGDLLRRSLKAKGESPLPALRGRFFKEAKERGYTGAEVEKLWQTMEKFSSYAFNKAHSASYAAMACQAVYLKAHHPLPYMAAVLNAGGGYYMLAEYIEEAKRLGIGILGPDANRSGIGFEVEEASIRVGFDSIKGLALRTAEGIVEERRGAGEFLSLEDFIARVRATKSELFTLIKAGVFDRLEGRRTRQVLRYVQGIDGVEPASDLEPREKAKMLLESLGFSPDGDPLELYEGKRPDSRIRDLRKLAGERVELVVRVVDARGKRTSSGLKYFYLFEDETGVLEGVGSGPCLSFGEPPVCCLRGEVRMDGTGLPKVFDCAFSRSF